MIKVVTDIVNAVQFPVAPNVKKGDVVQLTVESNSVCLVKSDGTAPLGFLTRRIKVVGKKTKAIKRYVGEVRHGRSVWETDNFDVRQRYPVNANLYINQDGAFTTVRPTETHPAVAMVLYPPTADNSTLQLIWF